MTTLMFRRFNLIWPTVKDVRDLLKQVLTSYQIDSEVIDNAGLVITEYLTNLMRHATGQDEIVTLIFRQLEQGIELLLLDNTPYFAALHPSTEQANLIDGELKEGGMGLALIKHYFPDYGYYQKNAENCFSLTFERQASKPQLVIVEPSIEQSNQVEDLLADQYSIKRFSDEQEALDYLLINDVDILLLDMQLNNSSAMELMQRLQNRRGNMQTVVLIMSEDNDWQTKASACAIGIDDYLPKPIDLNQLAFVLNRLQVRRKQVQFALTSELQSTQQGTNCDSQPINSELTLHPLGSAQQEESGDFLMLKKYKTKQLLLFADVMGHGFKASMHAQKIRGFLHGFLQSSSIGIEQIFNGLSQAMDSEQLTDNAIVTMLGLEIEGRNIRWLSAGHPLPILVNGSNQIVELKGSQPLIGLTPQHQYQIQQLHLSTDQHLLLYSDGLIENLSKSADLAALLPSLLPVSELTGLEWAQQLWQKSLPLLSEDIDDSSLLIIN